MRIKFLIGLAISLSVIALYIAQAGLIKGVERSIYDIYLRNSPQPPVSQDIVVVDISEDSLNELGQWPWPRYILGNVVQTLADSGASAIALDMILSEEDRTSPEKILSLLRADIVAEFPEELQNYDIYLANILRQTPSVLGFYAWYSGEKQHYEQKPVGLNVVWQAHKDTEGLDASNSIMEAASANFPIDVLYDGRVAAGFTNANTDADGIIRSVPLLNKLDGRIYPSLALATFMKAKGIRTAVVFYDSLGVVHIKLGSYEIPLSSNAVMTVPFKGAGRAYTYYNAHDILAGRVTADKLEGKIVFIGSSAIGLQDLRATPWDGLFPGVEIHAAVIDTILGSNYIITPSYTPFIQVSLILVLGMLCAFMFGGSRPAIYLPTAALVLAIVLALSYWLFTKGLNISPAYIVITIIAQAIAIIGIRFWQEESRKRYIQSAFGKYISPEVVSSIAEKDTDFLKGQKRELSILFSDIRGFTSLSEKLDPQQVVELLNEYFTPMTAIIRQYQGTTDKFIGDAIMAFWNAPLDVDNHASKAVRAGLQMQRALEELNPKLEAKYGFKIAMGIGIHSGWAYVGNMGSQEMQNYTVIGDSVNIASRLESLCKEYGVSFIVSRDTVDMCEPELAENFVLLGEVVVKGRAQAIEIFTLAPKEATLAAKGEN